MLNTNDNDYGFWLIGEHYNNMQIMEGRRDSVIQEYCEKKTMSNGNYMSSSKEIYCIPLAKDPIDCRRRVEFNKVVQIEVTSSPIW